MDRRAAFGGFMVLATGFAMLASRGGAPLPQQSGSGLSAQGILATVDLTAQAEGAQAAAEQRRRLEDVSDAPWVGSPDPRVTIVEFFDYRCPYCAHFATLRPRLLRRHPDLRVVFREWPVLGRFSRSAARMALAAHAQDSYARMHDALFARSPRTEQGMLALARDLGLHVERLRLDAQADAVDRHLRRTAEFARTLNLEGTPAMVINGILARGALPEDRLSSLIERARG